MLTKSMPEIGQSLFKWMSYISIFFLIISAYDMENLAPRVGWAFLPVGIWGLFYTFNNYNEKKGSKSFWILTLVTSCVTLILSIGNILVK